MGAEDDERVILAPLTAVYPAVVEMGVLRALEASSTPTKP
jgi:hypothetical protein